MAEKIIQIPPIIQVRELANRLNLSVPAIITELVKNGIMATINESIDFETAAIVADELGFKVEPEKVIEPSLPKKSSKKKLAVRPPVVTMLGHVDHGKTKLLDAIRSTNVIATESGGITQHIGAYQAQVPAKGKKTKPTITFLDTPGHEAFAAMRVHGVKITDIVVLVVAADDGVKPQTLEAISHIKAGNVATIVAINKIDKPTADPERVLRQLSEAGLAPEKWGGKVPVVKVSALNQTGIQELLEMIILLADMQELRADPDGPLTGVVVEAKLKTGVGPVATVLVQNGTLKPADILIIGSSWCRVRTLQDFTGTKIKAALPSMPVQISGLPMVPPAGAEVRGLPSEKAAKSFLAEELKKSHVYSLAKDKNANLTELNLVVKADVKGSLEAINNSLTDLSAQEVAVKIISQGVGAISESDINMALATHSQVIGFKVATPQSVAKLAQEKGVKIDVYEIIYELLDEIKKQLTDMLEPERTEVPVGKLKVLKVFRRSNRGGLFGGQVVEGQAEIKAHFRVKRGDEVIGEAKIESLQQDKKTKESVPHGFEAGIIYNGPLKIKADDMVEMFYVSEKKRQL